MHWADETARRIVERHQGPYVISSGTTPSGIVHLGNFRDVFTTWLVGQALRQLGHEVRHIHFWDDLDPLRRIPALFQDEVSQELIGTPIRDIRFRGTDYASHHIRQFELELQALGIEPEFIRQSEAYRSGRYDEHITHLTMSDMHSVQDDCSDGIRGILNRHRPESDSLPVDWNMMQGEKLVWRVDWPMRWAYYSVDFEPGGRDHTAPSGSYDTGSDIAREYFGIEPPVYLGYNFVQLNDTRMSSSRGNTATIADALGIYTREELLWYFARQRVDRDFSIDLQNPSGIRNQFSRVKNSRNEIERRSLELIGGST